MKPWEVEKTIEGFKKISGEESLKMGIELSEASLAILIDSIKDKTPNITDEEIKSEVYRILWDKGR